MLRLFKNNRVTAELCVYLLAFFLFTQLSGCHSLSPSLQGHICSIPNSLCLNNCCPEDTRREDIIVEHTIFILANNCKTKFANWVAYAVSKANFGNKGKNRHWQRDPALPANCTLSPSDYEDAFKTHNYHRGHQAPLGSFTASPYWEATNYLSNITPQYAALNQGAWNNLERQERKLAEKYKIVYVVTGTIYQKAMPALPKAVQSHRVPSAYWKVIAVKKNGAVKIAAFILPQNTANNAAYCQYLVALAAVQKTTGYKIFPANPPLKENLSAEISCKSPASREPN
jgi:endonuclease G